MTTWTVRALAERLGLSWKGVGETAVARVASLESAEADCLAFVSRAAYLDRLADCGAGAVIVAPEHAERVRAAAILAENPYAAYARAAQLLHPRPLAEPGIHESAVVDAGARLGADVRVGPRAVVEYGAELGHGTVVAAGAFIGRDASIGAGSYIGPSVTVAHECRLGARCVVQPGAVIGSDGFGFARDGDEWLRIPQIGRVVIGDDVEIGANTTIDRGTLDDTCIGNGVILDNQIQIAHNVRIGDHTAMAGCAGVAGSAVIGARCTIGGRASILGHLEIVDDVHITATSFVTKSIRKPGTYSSGIPVEEGDRWRRNAARFRQLDSLARRLAAIESSGRDDSPGED
jgi:UDP-3-O-[3-hydroxymyristoyl] glucosamine N-acyltransferase